MEFFSPRWSIATFDLLDLLQVVSHINVCFGQLGFNKVKVIILWIIDKKKPDYIPFKCDF